MPALLTTDTPEVPTTTKGRQRQQLERELRARAAAGRMRGVVIRAGDFYGGGRGNWFDQAVVKSAGVGKLVYPGPLDVPHAWAYLPDLARAFAALASRAAWNEAPAFETLHFAGHTFTGRELLGQIERAAEDLGLRPARGWRHAGLPWGLVRLAGVVRPIWRELARMSYLWRVPHALDGRALAHAVGPLPSTPPALALRAALRQLDLKGASAALVKTDPQAASH
jgi:nucleoside-diphosphate-sugar epimerase